MKSFEEALKERIEQKRQAREEAEREREKERAEAAARTHQVAERFREQVGGQYDADLGSLDVEVRQLVSYSDSHYNVTVRFEDGYVVLKNPVYLKKEASIEIVPLEDGATIWHAAHGEMHIHCENFLDACIYAVYGTSEPAS